MARSHLITAIERTAATNIRITPELADLLIDMCHIAPPRSGLKTSQLETNCTEASYSRLDRLDEMRFVNEVSNNDGSYLVSLQSSDDFHGSDNMLSAVNDELRELRRHARSDHRVRQLIATRLGIPQNQVDGALLRGDLTDRVTRLANIVNEIRSHPTIQQGNYQRLRWQSYSNVYEVTGKTLRMYRL